MAEQNGTTAAAPKADRGTDAGHGSRTEETLKNGIVAMLQETELPTVDREGDHAAARRRGTEEEGADHGELETDAAGADGGEGAEAGEADEQALGDEGEEQAGADDGAGDVGEDEESGEEGDAGEADETGGRELAEARERLRTLEAERDALREQLADVNLRRPLAPTPQDPLGFVQSREQLQEWSRNTRQQVAAIEDFIEDGTEGPGLREMAKSLGAVNEEGEPDRAKLKRIARHARETLAEAIPAREQHLAKRDQAEAIVRGLVPFMKTRDGEDYKNAMQVFEMLPEVRRYPQALAMAATYALGLREFKKLAEAAKGKAGANGTNGAPKRNGPPKGAVKGAGQTVTLPQARRGTPDRKTELEALRKKATREGATEEDVMAYNRRKLMSEGLLDGIRI